MAKRVQQQQQQIPSVVILTESSPRCLLGMLKLCQDEKINITDLRDASRSKIEVRWVRYHHDKHSSPHGIADVLEKLAQHKRDKLLIAAPFVSDDKKKRITASLTRLLNAGCSVVWAGVQKPDMGGTVSPFMLVKHENYRAEELAGYAPQAVSETSRISWVDQSPEQKRHTYLEYRMRQLYMHLDRPETILRDTLAELMLPASQGCTLPAFEGENSTPAGRLKKSDADELLGRYCEKGCPAIAGRSRAAEELKMQIRDLALLEMNVLLTGETGTGKELAAYFIHELGPRRTRPYFELNCAGLDDQTAESALFGHLKGAFTDAGAGKAALVAMADNGTLFLDELPSLSKRVQEKLLRFLETGEYLPVGSTVKHKATCRIIAGGQPGRIDERLNRDLYYRLSETTICLKSLHEYDPIDRIIVARNRADFMQGKTRVERDADGMATIRPINQQDINNFWQEIDRNAELIHSYSWPGNVRELYAMIKQSLCLARPFGELLEEAINKEKRTAESALTTDSRMLQIPLYRADQLITVDQLQRQYITLVHQLNRTEGWGLGLGELSKTVGIKRTLTFNKYLDSAEESTSSASS